MANRALFRRVVGVLFFLSIAAASAGPEARASLEAHTLVFEENHGQFGSAGDFLLQGPGFNFYAAVEPVIELYQIKPAPAVASSRQREGGGTNVALASDAQVIDLVRLRLDFVGADRDATAEGIASVAGKTNYLMGRNRQRWRTGVESYKRVRYFDLYSGIDIEYRVTDRLPEYIFHIEPGADPNQIAMNFAGASTSLTESGALKVQAGEYSFALRAPNAWQIIDGKRKPVEVAYQKDDRVISFTLGSFDADHELIIDPVLQFSSYFGGSGKESARGVHTDAAGNIYVIGHSQSPGLATAGAFDEENPQVRSESVRSIYCPNCADASPIDNRVERVTVSSFANAVIVAKFSPDGSQRFWTTYIRGDGAFSPVGVNSTGVSPDGEVAFGLHRAGSGWPLLNAAQPFNPDQGQGHGYVAKLVSDGSDLVFASYLQLAGGYGFDQILRGLDVGPNGEVTVVGGVAEDNNLPEVNPISGQSCAISVRAKPFVTLFLPEGTIGFSSCLGSDTGGGKNGFSGAREWARGVDMDAQGRIYILGSTSAADFPLVNPIQTGPEGLRSRDMFVSVIDQSTNPASLIFSTYFGPSRYGAAAGVGSMRFGFISPGYFPSDIVADSSGHITVTGVTNELHFPTVNALQDNLRLPRESYDIEYNTLITEAQDIFVTRLDPTTATVVFSTYLGGRYREDGLHAMIADEAGNIYISTVTGSGDYPVASPIQSMLAGDTNLGITKLTPEGNLVWSTFLGGSDDRMRQVPGGIAIDSGTGNVAVAATTVSTDFPLVDPLQNFNGGESDIVIAIINQSGDMDSDGDGVIDASDAFPYDPEQWRDTDGDGIGDSEDPDIDGDGVDNESDAFPQDSLWSSDNDPDGIGDVSDLFPNNNLVAYDFDDDGVGDFDDSDLDGDSVTNYRDLFPNDPAFSSDFDGDRVADAIDPDLDNDGIANVEDPAPRNSDIPVITFNMFDPANINVFNSPLPEGFSTPDGAVEWTAALDAAFSGQRSLGTRVMDHGQTAEVEFDLPDTFKAGTLIFHYKVESEPGSDEFGFLIDGVEQFAASGDTGWLEARFVVGTGEHILTWRYEKDGAGSVGLDAAWIDDIVVRRIGDVSVGIDNGVTTVPGGGQTTFDIPVINMSLNAAEGLTLDVPLPPEYSNPIWTCTSISGGANCASSSGAEPIAASFDLPPDSALLYRLTVDVQVEPEVAAVIGASLSIDSDFIDEQPANNTAEDADLIGLFGSGFE